jgi:Asp-tRNA(Asn)/Glu-tRNA(Gln) amidotransferase A subunit family amidase
MLAESHEEATTPSPLRIGVADNFSADKEVRFAFQAAVETIRTFAHPLVRASAPFDMPPFGPRNEAVVLELARQYQAVTEAGKKRPIP